MAKVSGSTVQAGQQDAVTQERIAAGPVGDLQKAVPQAAPTSFDDLIEGKAPPPELPEGELPADAVGAGIEAGLAREQDIADQRVPTLNERAVDTTINTWTPKAAAAQAAKPTSDGGLMTRATTMSNLFSGKGLTKLGLTPSTGPSREAALAGDTAAVAQIEGEQSPGSLTAAFNRSGAVTSSKDPETGKWTNSIDPMMLAIGSAVTENMISESAFGDTEADVQDIDPESPAATISKARGNRQLGTEIHREYSRLKNQKAGLPTEQYTDLSREEATTLGDAFKEMWHRANPNLIKRQRRGDNQVEFQLTPEGVEAMRQGAVQRKRFFPKKHIRPLKAPTDSGQLEGELGRVATTAVKGRVRPENKDTKLLRAATKNLNTVPNVVDKQRERILYATILPVLSGQLDWSHPFAEINNIGASKMEKFQAAQAAYEREVAAGAPAGEPYNALTELDKLMNTVAQHVRAVAQERNGANFLSYSIEAFNGRITPQQSFFDPTGSKAVRFVTRNAVPAKATPGSRVDKNLRQMYAMMLVKGADTLLPEGREESLKRNSPKLEKWGDRLAEVLDDAMTEAEADAIAAAIAAGTPLTDPNFPEVRPVALDPQRDSELISEIQRKGEDGPHFIDGLIDYAKYAKANREGKPYLSYFNAYIDGKTNGIASNGIQMGSSEVAFATGVLRNNTNELLDDGDIRDKLRDSLLDKLDNDGFEGSLENVDTGALYDVARAVYSHRDLNKATTMTFGYGKELNSFKQDISESLDLLVEKAKADDSSTVDTSAAILDAEVGREELVDMLHKLYVGELSEALSKEAIQSRSLMRSAAMLHAVTDQLFSLTGPSGFQLNIGGTETLGYDKDKESRYRIYEGDADTRFHVGQYETKPTASAIERERDKEGNLSATPGEIAYGGSVPAPVQSLDAATVAMSVTGRSWDKLKSASNGNPYMHTIYDAFKMDAMGYDVVLQEVNNNWLKASMEWSYLEETLKATQEAMKKWDTEMKNLPQEHKVDTTMAGPGRMIGWLLQVEQTDRGPRYKNLVNKLKNLMADADYEDAQQAASVILKHVRESGVDPSQPVDVMTVRQIRKFVDALQVQLRFDPRMRAMIEKTNANKKRLKKKIEAQKVLKGNEVLQYYSH